MDEALRDRYPHVMPATFRGREALVVLGPYKVSTTYLRWLFGHAISIEEALADEHLRHQVYRHPTTTTWCLNPAHVPKRSDEKPPRFLILVRSHNGSGDWKRRLVPGDQICLEAAERSPDTTGEYPIGAFATDIHDEALTG